MSEHDPVGALAVVLESFSNITTNFLNEAAGDRERIVPANIKPWNHALARRTETCAHAMESWMAIAKPVFDDLTEGYVNRPHWALVNTPDGVAAQMSYGALSSLWKALGVKDQTQAMERIKELLYKKHGYDNP